MEIHWQVQRESSDSSEGGGELLRREMDVLIVEALLMTVITAEVVNWCKHGYPPFSFFSCILATVDMLIILPLSWRSAVPRPWNNNNPITIHDLVLLRAGDPWHKGVKSVGLRWQTLVERDGCFHCWGFAPDSNYCWSSEIMQTWLPTFLLLLLWNTNSSHDQYVDYSATLGKICSPPKQQQQ